MVKLNRSDATNATVLTSLAGAVVVLVFAAAAAVPDGPSPEWKTTEIDGRRYVALDAIAVAHQMEPGERADPLEAEMAGRGHSLTVKGDRREAIIDGVRHWLSFPARRDDEDKVFVSLTDLEETILPAFSPDTVGALGPVKTIVFDPGHGGHDKGAQSRDGLEKDYALDIVNRARRILEDKGIKVVQTRLTDFFVALHERPKITAEYEDPIFVSVHLNSAEWNPSARGVEIFAYTPHGAPSTGDTKPGLSGRSRHPGDGPARASAVLATSLQHSILGHVGGFDRGVKRARFAVLKHADVPAVLVESGFLSNPREAAKINSPSWRESFAQALAEGLVAYISLANEGYLPPRATDLGRVPTREFVSK